MDRHPARGDELLLLATIALPTLQRLRAPELYGPSMGRLFTPRHVGSLQATIDAGIPFAADNDCFQGLDRYAFERMLASLAPAAADVLWITAPDVVGDADATLQRFRRWGVTIRERHGFPVALVLQDGMTPARVPWSDLDALFIGGSTDWKLGADAAAITREARQRGVWVHMGRVNSYSRARYAWEIGCASVDGTGWARFKTAMMPRWTRLVAEIAGESSRERRVA